LTQHVKRLKFVLWKETFNFRSRSLGIDPEPTAPEETQIEEETQTCLLESGLLEEWQYEAMLNQDFQVNRTSPATLLEKLKKVLIVKHRDVFENLNKDSLFMLSFKILAEDSNIEKAVVNGLIFSFYLCLQNCLNEKSTIRLFYVESLNLVPDYRGKGKITSMKSEDNHIRQKPKLLISFQKKQISKHKQNTFVI
jgi:hypothetical protein